MSRLLYTTVFLIVCQCSFANQDWQYRNTKGGITMIAVGGYHDSIGIRKMFDAFLDKLAQKTERHGTKFEILLLLDQGGIFTRTYLDWAATMAFDTLREIDKEFIEAYNFYRMGDGFKKMIISNETPSNKYVYDLPEPIDINSTFDTSSTKEVGLKIIYDFGENDSLTFFDRIYTLVQYGIDNIDEIKKSQRRMILNYDLNKIKVSVLTIDTGKLKSIPLISLGFDRYNLDNHKIRHILVGCGVVLVGFSVYLNRRRFLQTKKNSSGVREDKNDPGDAEINSA